MEIIKKTLVVLVLCSLIMGTVPVSVLAQKDSLDNNIFEHKGPDLPSGVEYEPDKIIVKFIGGTSDETISMINLKNKVVSSEKIIKKNPKAVENEKTKILKKQGLDMIYLLKLPKNSDVNKMVSKYNENPDVEYAELNYKVYVDATFPDDEYFSLLWGMHNTGQSEGTADADIDAPEAWDIETENSNEVVIAVIDTGVDYNHEDLAENMWVNEVESGGVAGEDDDDNGYTDDIHGYDFCTYGQVRDNDPMDDSGHGTHCSGTIAAEGDNNIGVVGVSWNAKIMALKFLGDGGTGYTADAVPAIYYAIDNGADIMSNSWGGGSYSLTLENAISDANDAGILFVAAAGNSRKNTDLRPHYPSSYDVPNIISVAATDDNDALAGFSNYGPNSVDLGAPGVDILSTYPSGYAWGDGTSMAAPHVSGAAALIMAQNPTISVADLKARILESVDPISSLNRITVTGGRLNVFNCLEANTEPDTTPPIITSINSLTTSTTATITWTTDELSNSTVNYGTTNSLGSTETDGTMITSHSITLTGLSPETTYYYEVESTDAAGNTATDNNDETYYTFTTTAPDTEAPVIADATGDTTGTTGEPVTISATITDYLGVVSATVHYTPIDGTETTAPMTKDASYVWSADVPVASDKVGTITYYINAEDAAGNTAGDPKTGTYSITVTDNDTPVAEAGPDREVLVGQEVTFDGSTSSDNIDITGYSWDYDVSNGIQVDATDVIATHTYTATGTYTVTLTVTDAADYTDSDTLIVNVIEESDTMHITNIDMSTTSIRLNGWYTYVTATVTIVDTNNNQVAGATVYGHWSGLTGDTNSGTTGLDGKVALDSDSVKNAEGTFTFKVDDVVLSGWTYDPTANVETSDSITV